MRVSVIIPAFNAEKTVGATIDSVLRQTVEPYEILALDDGSTDATYGLLNSYTPRVTLIKAERNRGLCAARNQLCSSATGDWIALLDADDVWHPDHLATKCRLFRDFPRAALFFVGHRIFTGYGNYEWEQTTVETHAYRREVMEAVEFFQRYNETPGYFYPSVSSFPRSLLTTLGDEPFKTAAEDAYFMYSAILTGPAVYDSTPLTAIRVLDGSLSSNRLRVYGGQVEAFVLLEHCYGKEDSKDLRRAFRRDFAGARRQYAKRLLGTKNIERARDELRQSFGASPNPLSLAKSAGLLAASFLPRVFQPRWPSPFRESSELRVR